MSAVPRGAYREVANRRVSMCKASTTRNPDLFCGRPATVPVTVACVHEHVRASFACPQHAPELDRRLCGVCWRADGHRCRLTVLAVRDV